MFGAVFGNPIILILSIVCAIITTVEEENQKLYHNVDPEKEHFEETKKAYDEAMKLPTTKERVEYFSKGIYDRIHKRMLNEISRRK